MPLIVTTAHHTTTGLREHNEDFAGATLSATPENSGATVVAAIADGVSGSDRGREAAEQSVRMLLTEFDVSANALAAAQSLGRVIRSINQRIRQHISEDPAHLSMATTLTALALREDRYYFAHVGDSRLYLLRKGALTQLSTDHVANAADRSYVLTRAIGKDDQIAIDEGSGGLRQDDIFLLATDGVWSALPEGDLEWHLSTLAEEPPNPGYTAKLLVDAALAHGTKDNATALVLRVLSLPPD